MKIGDLVRLSYYGTSLKMFIHLHDRVGLIKDCAYDHYIVEWCGSAAPTVTHRRKDLKLAK